LSRRGGKRLLPADSFLICVTLTGYTAGQEDDRRLRDPARAESLRAPRL
jgi:hypothetical protein